MSNPPSRPPFAPDTPIDALALPARTRNVLQRADIRHVGEVVLLTEAGVLGLRHARRADWTAVRQAQLRSGLDTALVPIVYLPVPASLATLLIHQGIRRVGELLALSEAEVRALPGMSASEAALLVRALERFGRALRRDEA